MSTPVTDVSRAFTKRPIDIEAILWTGGNVDAVLTFIYSDERWKEGIASGTR